MHAPFIYTSLNDAIDLPSLNDTSSIYKPPNNAIALSQRCSIDLHFSQRGFSYLHIFQLCSIDLYNTDLLQIRDVDPCNFSLLPIRLFVWMNPDPKKSQDETEIPFLLNVI